MSEQVKPEQIQITVEATAEENIVENVRKLDVQSGKQLSDFSEAEHKKREELIDKLTIISALWLLFTASVILLRGFPTCFALSDSVMIAFITSSLGTVLGLWGIGLGYYFVIRK